MPSWNEDVKPPSPSSIEKMVRRELRHAAFWRAVVAVLNFPGSFLNAVAGIVHRCADLFDAISDAAFYFECEAARKYRALTGIDLGFAAKGDIERYGGTNPRALALAEAQEFDDEEESHDI